MHGIHLMYVTVRSMYYIIKPGSFPFDRTELFLQLINYLLLSYQVCSQHSPVLVHIGSLIRVHRRWRHYSLWRERIRRCISCCSSILRVRLVTVKRVDSWGSIEVHVVFHITDLVDKIGISPPILSIILFQSVH